MAFHVDLVLLSKKIHITDDAYVWGTCSDSDDALSWKEIKNLLTEGNYEEVLYTGFAKKILKTCRNGDINSICKDVETNIQAIVDLHDASEEEYFRECCLLGVAVSCVQLFVQSNWTGPVPESSPSQVLYEAVESKDSELQDLVFERLSTDGDSIHCKTNHGLYLILAKVILQRCASQSPKCETWQWWMLRSVYCHQCLLSERSPSLKALALELIDQVLKKEFLFKETCYRELATQFYLEASHLCDFYYEHKRAKTYLEKACESCGVIAELTGMLGRRTRFQQSDVAQLVLKVGSAELEGGDAARDSPPEVLPKDIPLNDDTVLNRMQLAATDGQTTAADEQTTAALGAVQQAVVLTLCQRQKRTQEGQSSIVLEEVMAYLNYLLQTPLTWAVQTVALFQRSHWEWQNTRRLERAMAQLEELVAQVGRPRPAAADRLELFYSANPPTQWEVQRRLGVLFEKVGAVSAALEVFLRLESWEEVIRCYNSLGKKEKAERLVREQLAVKETPNMWCYLGDVLHTEEPYLKAWELSEGHCGRAQKALGYLYVSRQEFEKSLPCFEKAVRINALQVGVWFTYGCAALASEQFTLAANAFRTCVNLDSNNYEAWTNLSSAYIKSNQKPRAFSTLQEALKCEYENWRIWENFLLVATDVGQFAEVIRAYHRMLDLREKHTDAQVLDVLVRAVVEGIEDSNGKSAAPLRPKALELMGRLTSQVTNNGEVWRLYARLLTEGCEEVSDTDQERALQYLQKAHRSFTLAPNWEKDVAKCLDIMKETIALANGFLLCGRRLSNAARAVQLLASGRLAVKGVLAKVKQTQTDPITGEMPTGLEEPLTTLVDLLEDIVSLIEERKSQL